MLVRRDLLVRAARAVVLVAGLTLLLVGLGLAVLLGPDGAWSATATVPAGRSAVLLEPDVVSVLGPRVAVTATGADGQPLFVARARSDDAVGYVAGTPHALVTGVGADRRLGVLDEPGTTALTAPQDADVWQQTSTGRLTWAPTQGAQSVVVARADGRPLPAVELTVTWHRAGWIWVPVALVLAGALVTALPRLAGLLLGRSRPSAPPAPRVPPVPPTPPTRETVDA